MSAEAVVAGNGSFWLTRIVFLRCLGFVYAFAYLAAFHQLQPLIGESGLTPAYLLVGNNVHQGVWKLIRVHPTLFWILPPTDVNLNGIALIGFLLSSFVCVYGAANVPIMFTLWAMYISIINIGQTWFSFGWESQLLETGFVAIFLVPLFTLHRFPKHTPTPLVCRWALRWLMFRIMFGSGMIKLRGDPCWRDLTCMNYHYQTQPIPNPLSPHFHASPEWFHRFETLSNHLLEVVLPWLLLPLPLPLPCGYSRALVTAGAVLQILFQVVLILSGNLSFLNWLTIVPAVMALDDRFLSFLFPNPQILAANSAEIKYRNYVAEMSKNSIFRRFFRGRFFSNRERNDRVIAEENKSKEPEKDREKEGEKVGEKEGERQRIMEVHAEIEGEKGKEEEQGDVKNGENLEQNQRTVWGFGIGGKSGGNVGTNQSIGETPRLEYSNLSDIDSSRSSSSDSSGWWRSLSISVRRIVSFALLCLLSYLSYPVIVNLLSPNQRMNMNFDAFRIVNSHGNFGSITRVRHEVVLQGTHSSRLTENTTWRDFEFRCKPGDINRAPCFISPYHIRIDWLMWFAAFQNYQHCGWLVHLADKLLRGDEMVNALLEPAPFSLNLPSPSLSPYLSPSRDRIEERNVNNGNSNNVILVGGGDHVLKEEEREEKRKYMGKEVQKEAFPEHYSLEELVSAYVTLPALSVLSPLLSPLVPTFRNMAGKATENNNNNNNSNNNNNNSKKKNDYGRKNTGGNPFYRFDTTQNQLKNSEKESYGLKQSVNYLRFLIVEVTFCTLEQFLVPIFSYFGSYSLALWDIWTSASNHMGEHHGNAVTVNAVTVSGLSWGANKGVSQWWSNVYHRTQRVLNKIERDINVGARIDIAAIRRKQLQQQQQQQSSILLEHQPQQGLEEGRNAEIQREIGVKSRKMVGKPPKYIRAELYEYRYTAPLSAEERAALRGEGWEIGRWWIRKHVSSYLPPIERNNPSVAQFLAQKGML